MFIKQAYKENDLASNTKQLITELKGFAAKTDRNTAIYANVANHLKHYFGSKINWVGFYFVNKQNNLDLGAFNGLPAVTTIQRSKGICGLCLTTRTTIVVDDVCNHPSHIACDVDSKSEICVPVWIKTRMVALLDIDAPTLAFFGPYKELLEEYLKEVSELLNYNI